MELCETDLKKLIEMMRGVTDHRFQSILFFISCQLSRDMTEGLKCLHSQTPPLIHRDLKPANVLISVQNNRLLAKITDFGLAVEHTNTDHTEGKGTLESEILIASSWPIESLETLGHVFQRHRPFEPQIADRRLSIWYASENSDILSVQRLLDFAYN